MRTLSFIAGTIGTLTLVVAMVQSMLISRSNRNVISTVVNAVVRFVSRAPLPLMRSYVARDRWLSFAAPITLLVQLTLYAALFILALGLMVWGTTDLSLRDALFQSGSTFTTLGIVQPVNDASTVISFLAAFLGLVVVAVFIGYLLGLNALYNAREAVMARLATFAGDPAWGPEVLARANRIGRPLGQEPDAATLLDWISQLRLNEVMNPALSGFRSASPNRHWMVSLLAALDAVALRLALGASSDIPADVQVLIEGAHTLHTCVNVSHQNWRVERHILDVVHGREFSQSAALADDEWAHGWSELRAANVVAQADEAGVRQRFEALRWAYAEHAHTLAERFYAVRAPWSGDRTPATPVVSPLRAAEAD